MNSSTQPDQHEGKRSLDCGVGDDGWWDWLGKDQNPEDSKWQYAVYAAAKKLKLPTFDSVTIEKVVTLPWGAVNYLTDLVDAFIPIPGISLSGRGEPYALISFDIDGRHFELAFNEDLEVLGEFNAKFVKSNLEAITEQSYE